MIKPSVIESVESIDLVDSFDRSGADKHILIVSVAFHLWRVDCFRALGTHQRWDYYCSRE
jgi:hypothetical protein